MSMKERVILDKKNENPGKHVLRSIVYRSWRLPTGNKQEGAEQQWETK